MANRDVDETDGVEEAKGSNTYWPTLTCMMTPLSCRPWCLAGWIFNGSVDQLGSHMLSVAHQRLRPQSSQTASRVHAAEARGMTSRGGESAPLHSFQDQQRGNVMVYFIKITLLQVSMETWIIWLNFKWLNVTFPSERRKFIIVTPTFCSSGRT